MVRFQSLSGSLKFEDLAGSDYNRFIKTLLWLYSISQYKCYLFEKALQNLCNNNDKDAADNFITALEHAIFQEDLVKLFFNSAVTSCISPFSSYIPNHVSDGMTLFLHYFLESSQPCL